MKTVWKYEVAMVKDPEIEMPVGAQILDVQVQEGVGPCVWALVDPSAPKQVRAFRLAGTGHPIDDGLDLEHVGTFQLHGGELVFHLFEVRP